MNLCGRSARHTDVIKSIERDAFAKCMNPPVDDGLIEYRCSCGRLLGRFNGQAEVKCPKCGKMNVIGVENHGKIKGST